MLKPCRLPSPPPQWSPDDRQLASGGNDNALLIWDAAAAAAPALRFAEHTAAVKAISWWGARGFWVLGVWGVVWGLGSWVVWRFEVVQGC